MFHICNRSSNDESRLLINQVCLSRVHWRVQSNTCSDLCFENFNSSFLFYSSFFFFSSRHSLFIWLSLLFCFAWIIHEWQFWLHQKHLSFISSQSNKLICYCSSWIKTRNYPRLSNLFFLANKFWKILWDCSNISSKKILYSSIEHWVRNLLTMSFESSHVGWPEGRVG